jgi:hypothetical protein
MENLGGTERISGAPYGVARSDELQIGRRLSYVKTPHLDFVSI